LTETPENNEPTSDEESENSGGAPESAGAADAGEGESQLPQTDASPDPTPDASGEDVVTEDPIAEQPSQEAAEVVAETEAAGAPEAAGPPEAAGEPEAAGAPEAATEAEAAGEVEAAPSPSVEEEQEIDVTPRVKPEIPGADLEPDLLPDAEQYLDAEAQAAAEAEAEAAAERARAEAEDEHARPIADAAIDLAAGARYTATGKRKTAVARVILKPGTGAYLINGKPLDVFFPRETLQRMIRQPLETVGYEARMDVVARMHGGGVSAQAGALRHGISRALIDADPNLRGELKRRGYLTRDPRVKERKKAGLKKARKRPQFSKR
jgi:small subunit ribosomal protein S9